MKNRLGIAPRLLLACACLLVLASAAEAQAPQTFVSAQGKDSYPCDNPDKPCRSINAALAKVQAAGEVVILDSGAFQPFTVNKSVTVAAAPGAYAGISVPTGTNAGIAVSADPTDTVVLRGLTLNGMGGIVGIAFMSGAALHVEGCVVNGLSSTGITTGPGGAKFYARDVTLRNNAGGGILLNAFGAGPLVASLENVRVDGNGTGINIQSNTRVTIRDSVVAGNKFLGIVAGTPPGSGATAEVIIDNCKMTGNLSGPVAGLGVTMSVSGSVITHNGSGINTFPGSTVYVSATTVTHNVNGLLINGGSLLSRGNNTVEANMTDGSFTGSFAAK
jgi:hypothetical protein